MLSSTELERYVISSLLYTAGQTNSKLVNSNTSWATCKSKLHFECSDPVWNRHVFNFFCFTVFNAGKLLKSSTLAGCSEARLRVDYENFQGKGYKDVKREKLGI